MPTEKEMVKYITSKDKPSDINDGSLHVVALPVLSLKGCMMWKHSMAWFLQAAWSYSNRLCMCASVAIARQSIYKNSMPT